MTAEPTKPTLRQAAMAAHAECEQQRLEIQAERQRAAEARIRRDFKNDFDCEPTIIRGNTVTVDEGGLLIHKPLLLTGYPNNSGSTWTLTGTCPRCGEVADSQWIRDVRDLGQQLAAFEPGFDHQCPGPKQIRPPSAAEAVLLEALRNWMREGVDRE